MIRSITFKHRKSSTKEYETCLVFTDFALRLIHKDHQFENIQDFIDYLLDFSKVPSNSIAEISYQLPKKAKGKWKISAGVNMPIETCSAKKEWQKKYLTLTEQEKKIFDFILRNYKQKQICQALNIKVNTEKGYRKAVHMKMEISDFSKISDSDRELLLRFAHKK